MENLATIQRIREIKVHSGADALELATVLGWQVVVKKNEFLADDLVVYIAIDTVLPETPIFEFLRNKHFRIKPIRLRGEYSNGICFPLSILEPWGGNITNDFSWVEGQDVTEILSIKHYEKPIPAELAGQAIGSFPGFLRITDELNLRSYPDALPELWGRPYYITRKEDGSSSTYFLNNNEFGVCSRRIHLKDTEGNGFWRIARKYDIESKLRIAFPDKNIAIQGECVGPGVQKNPIGLAELDFRLFNIFDIDSRSFLDYDKIIEFCKTTRIPMVPVVSEGNAFGYNLDELIQLAQEQKYGDKPGEGIVIRPREPFYSKVLKTSWSSKVKNQLYKEE